jgi:diguanylate cyclase (GGDEF)-like protein
MAISLGVTAAYTLAAAWEFWRKRSDRLKARWPLIVLISIHGALFFAGMVEAASGVIPLDSPPPLSTWFGLIHVEVLFYVIGTAIFVSAITRERAELDLRLAAEIDVLTGVASRRSFMDLTRGMLAECLDRDDPLCFILFDLDRFKQVNDTYGHATGDEILRIFSHSARQTLRNDDLIGRIGGEEFGVALRGLSEGAAYVIADRIRIAFSRAAEDSRGISATVSAGVSSAHLDSTLDSLISSADNALYRAKAKGRDRIEIAERERGEPPSDPVSNVVKIA